MDNNMMRRHFPDLFEAIKSGDQSRVEVELNNIHQFFGWPLHKIFPPFVQERSYLHKSIPKVICEVSGRRLQAVLDTASNWSFLSRRLAQELDLFGTLEVVQERAITVNSEILFIGRVVAEIRLVDHVITHPLLVCEQFDRPFLVFGYDFLDRFDASLDMGNRVLTLHKIDLCLSF